MFLVYGMSMGLLACTKVSVSESSSSVIRTKMENLKPSETIRIEDLYIVPEYFSYILTSPPDVIEETLDRGNVLKEVQDKIGISVKSELQKYFERQKNYNKTSIFSDIP